MPERTKQPQPLTVQLRHVLKVVRERLLLTNVKTVAADLGISRSNVYRLRRGEGAPSVPTLLTLAFYFDTGLRLEESPEPQPNGKGPALPPAVQPMKPNSQVASPAPWE